MQTQYCTLNYRNDLYFYDYELAMKVNEVNHSDRDIRYEIERQNALITSSLESILMNVALLALRP